MKTLKTINLKQIKKIYFFSKTLHVKNDMTTKPFTSNIIIDSTIQTTKHGYMSKCSLLPKESQ